MQRLTLKTEASLRLRLMQDGISELGFSMRIDSQSELGMYISMNVNSESSDFMNTLSESELRFVINAEK